MRGYSKKTQNQKVTRFPIMLEISKSNQMSKRLIQGAWKSKAKPSFQKKPQKLEFNGKNTKIHKNKRHSNGKLANSI